jgi:hypothetical protein
MVIIINKDKKKITKPRDASQGLLSLLGKMVLVGAVHALNMYIKISKVKKNHLRSRHSGHIYFIPKYPI